MRQLSITKGICMSDQDILGLKCIYLPIKKSAEDNLHFPGIVEGIGKNGRIKIRVFMLGADEGVLRWLSKSRVYFNQDELLGEPATLNH